jgi:hypothetical protein
MPKTLAALPSSQYATPLGLLVGQDDDRGGLLAETLLASDSIEVGGVGAVA